MPTCTNLVCEYSANPIGIDVAEPRLSWQLSDARRGAAQMAYQILVASSPDELTEKGADIWNSGKVTSDQCLHVAYVPAASKALRSGQRCYWTVRAWDKDGQPTPFAPAAFWEMGLLKPSDWAGQWIGSKLVGSRFAPVPPPLLRKGFTLAKPVASARLYATALGLYEAYINGQRVLNDVFTPGWTSYRNRVQYHTYDVTDMLRPGANAIGAMLGDGWYCGQVAWEGRQVCGDRPAFLAQLVLTFTDGSTQTIATDGSWKTRTGPIVASDLLQGESYDARLEVPDWCQGQCDESAWDGAEVLAAPKSALVAPAGPPVRRTQELAATLTGKSSGRYLTGPRTRIWDMQQNMVGRVRLKVYGPAGATVTLRHAEILNADGTIYVTNLRSAKCTDYYTLKGSTAEKPEIYEPRFTFHGFRYVEIARMPEGCEAADDTVTGIVLHTDMPMTGTFECSHPLVNQLQSNIQWGQRGNFLEAPTDCPQRDERLGWTGDTQVFIRTATHNMNVAGFFTKWARDLSDDQCASGAIPSVLPSIPSASTDSGPAWADAALICPWTIYQTYGDTRILSQHYATFERFAKFLQDTSVDFTRGSHVGKGWDGYGDWLAQDSDIKSNNYTGRTPKDVISTAFFAHAMQLMSNIAKVLGKQEDEAKYADLAEKVRAAFIKRYITASGFVHAHTQTGYVLALHFDLLPAALRPVAVQHLVDSIQQYDNHLSTGFVGTPYLNHVLTAGGRLDVAYKLLLQETCPSWLYPVTQGATTIWERWDGWTKEKGPQDPGMNSYNHYAYGAIGHWMYNTLAGLDLDPASPAYKHSLIKPQPPADGAITHAKATLQTLYGLLSSAWKIEGQTFHLDVIVPANTTATVRVPTKDAAKVTESGKPAKAAEGVKFVKYEDNVAVYEVAAGTYAFAAPAVS